MKVDGKNVSPAIPGDFQNGQRLRQNNDDVIVKANDDKVTISEAGKKAAAANKIIKQLAKTHPGKDFKIDLAKGQVEANDPKLTTRVGGIFSTLLDKIDKYFQRD
jgi:hypothetical protein